MIRPRFVVHIDNQDGETESFDADDLRIVKMEGGHGHFGLLFTENGRARQISSHLVVGIDFVPQGSPDCAFCGERLK